MIRATNGDEDESLSERIRVLAPVAWMFALGLGFLALGLSRIKYE